MGLRLRGGDGVWGANRGLGLPGHRLRQGTMVTCGSGGGAMPPPQAAQTRMPSVIS